MATTKKTETHSPLFQKYYERYRSGNCKAEHIMQIVNLGRLTMDEYNEIVGISS